jgi:hypothetical protein
MWIRVGAIAVVMAGCGKKEEAAAPAPAPVPPAAPEPAPATTPNELLQRGTPTFVIGTAGDARADRAVRAQVELIRALLFPDASVVEDTAVAAGTWPDHPLVYGGPHVNHALAGMSLPFALTENSLELGGERFEGEGIALITLVPAAADHPAFLLYAGTGMPGVAEINAVKHGPDPIVVADAFGVVTTGRWESGKAMLAPRARRLAWRLVERPLPGVAGAAGAVVRFAFPEQLPPASDEAAVIDAGMRGLGTAISKLAIERPVSLTFYVYPDRRSKMSITGDAGDGHAVLAARALHVVTAPANAIEGLVAHEGTHVLAYEAWGPAGTSLVGEGLAVWASGRYAGTRLDQWKATLRDPAPIAELLGPAFRKLPENRTYPVAGLLVEAAIAQVGLAGVRDHLLGATGATWDAACAAAGTSTERLQRAVAQ